MMEVNKAANLRFLLEKKVPPLMKVQPMVHFDYLRGYSQMTPKLWEGRGLVNLDKLGYKRRR